MSNLLRDARIGTRLLFRNRGFAAVAVLTLALGIASTTAIFSVIYATFIAPLPYRDADRLVMLYETNPEFGGYLVPPEFSATVMQKAFEEGKILADCAQMQISSNSYCWNEVLEDDRTQGNRFGGIRPYWLNEAGLREGTIGRAPFTAVLSFLRREPAVAARCQRVNIVE